MTFVLLSIFQPLSKIYFAYSYVKAVIRNRFPVTFPSMSQKVKYFTGYFLYCFYIAKMSKIVCLWTKVEIVCLWTEKVPEDCSSNAYKALAVTVLAAFCSVSHMVGDHVSQVCTMFACCKDLHAASIFIEKRHAFLCNLGLQ